MICFHTKDNWAGAQITVVVSGTSHLWTCTSSAHNALEAVNQFSDWFGSAYTPARVATPTYARNPTDGGIKVTFAFTVASSGAAQSVTMTPNASATSLLGFGTATGSVLTASASAAGTWSPVQANGRVSYSLDYPMVLGTGDAAGAGAIRQDVPGHGHYKPTVEAIGNAIDAGRLTGVMAGMPTGRYGWIYTTLAKQWLFLAFGAVTRSAAGRNLYKFSFDVGRTS